MLNFDLDQMLFTIPAENHTAAEITRALKEHPEVKFVSLVGLDIGGHDTDEKIPVALFLSNMERFLKTGVQTDGSSVVLPEIAELNNAKVDIIPDAGVNWFVDHNFGHTDRKTGLPVGTLRIPSFLVHNDVAEVGSRAILRDAVRSFEKDLTEIMTAKPYALEYLGISHVSQIAKVEITAATELEFWVKTPEDRADREQLSTAEDLKEQYWKRTIGPVRTAMEEVMLLLDQYGFEMEMGHKEVGGVKAKMSNSGNYDHVMEQLEIDWKYTGAMQAADNENQVKYVVRDIFRMHGLEVSFMAKPIEGVAGSGEHTHMGLAATLQNGERINLFSCRDMKQEFLNPIGFGALMGILKNYDVINPFISATNDAFNRLKPGYEAPVCVVTSLGHGVEHPSRNRTVLVGLVRDMNNPLATRFELRAPNPKSNTYLVVAASYMAMMDGIRAALNAEKTPRELQASLSKAYGQPDFYLETDRLYRSEKNVFEEYTEEERNHVFGPVPRTVWENLRAFERCPEKLGIFQKNQVMTPVTLSSYKTATLAQWAMELQSRIVPDTMELVRSCGKRHDDAHCVDYDKACWEAISRIRDSLGRDTLAEQCLLTRIVRAINTKDYETASDLQVQMQEEVKELTERYRIYKKNLF